MSPLRLWRQWRLARWSSILNARERRLESFMKSPFDTHFRTESSVKNKMRSEINKAKYRVDLITGSLRARLPVARLESGDQ
jgi:hypothetical protein